MVIVPDDATLLIEALVQNKDIGFVHEGKAAEIEVESFPFTRYGLISGEAVKLSRDSMSRPNQDGQGGNEQQQPGNLFYAEVSMSRDEILVGERWVRLSPGMNVSVEIQTGSRRAIDVFLSPFLEYQDEALRKR